MAAQHATIALAIEQERDRIGEDAFRSVPAVTWEPSPADVSSSRIGDFLRWLEDGHFVFLGTRLMATKEACTSAAVKQALTIPVIAPSRFIRFEKIPMMITGKKDDAARPNAKNRRNTHRPRPNRVMRK